MATTDAGTLAHQGAEVHGTKGSSGGGRFLRASRRFDAGEQIALFANPLVAIPFGAAAKSVCNRCLSLGAPVKACAGCRAVAYCGAACQKAHWSLLHKQECRAFRLVRKEVSRDWLPTPVRALLQILLLWGRDGVKGAVDRLEGNVERFRAMPIWRDFALQALGACTYAGWEATTENLELAAEILCKVSPPTALDWRAGSDAPCKTRWTTGSDAGRFKQTPSTGATLTWDRMAHS